MKKTITFVLLALFCICGFAQTIDPVLTQEMRQRSDDEKIKVIVIMKSQYDRQQLGRRAAHFVTRAERREFVVNELKQFAEASQYELRSTLSEMERQDMTTEPKVIWMANALYFSATKQAINDLAMRRDIALIGLDEKKYALFGEEFRPASNTREITSNVTQVNADQVWNLGYTGQGVVVAVIDTGVNYNHLELADHLWDGGAEYPHHGYDFCNNDNDPMDDNSHGTHCAGTVCGDGTAGSQTGMAPDATLMCIKVLSSGGNGSAATTCYAMQWAAEQGADLFSMSLGWANSTIAERTLFRNTCAALLDAGVVGAIAAGNEGDKQGSYPIPNNVRAPGSCPPPYMDPIQANNAGDLSCAICVGAVNANDNAAYFTSRGPVTWSNTEFGDYPYTAGSTTDFGLIRPDVCAPGVDIKSAYYIGNNGYTTMSGTSMATPCTAGCISLLLSKNINATPEEICQVLEETAVPLATGKSNTYGYGRIDVLAAINAMSSGPLTLNSFTVNDSQGNNDGKLNAGESVTLSLTLTNESDLALTGATMTLTSESEYVTITDGSESLPRFNVGQTRTISNMFAFTLSNDAPAKRNVQFTGEIFAGGVSLGTIRISVMVYGHILRLDEVTVLNDNNGNGSLEPGETANLHILISNVGNDMAASVVGVLSTTYSYLTINSNNKSFGSITANNQASVNYSVTLSNSAPQSYTINFGLDLVDAAQKHTNVDFELWRKAITLTSNPAGAGTLSGGGYYGQGQTCTITATPNNGYAFVSWTLNGTVVSYLPTYTFEVTDEANYVANFQAFNNSIFVGNPTGIISYLPSHSFYRYTLSQQIFTATEMNSGSCDITSVSFFNTSNSSYSRTMTIYMVNTSKSTFENNYDWITVSETNQVFSGSVTRSAGSWTTIYFNTPFHYDGTSNVALIVDDNTGSYSSTYYNRVFATDSNQSIYIYSDGTNYDPYSPSNYSGSLPTVKNDVVFGKATYGNIVTVTANPTNGGSVTGGGNCYYGQPITITATANNGYVFNNWTKNGQVVSYLSTYSFNVTESATYVANFEAIDGIAIGDAIHTNYSLPTYYYNSLTEQIYTAAEMGGESTDISSVSFFNTSGYSRTRNLSVYLAHTNKTSFESSTDWIAVTENDLVFSGNVTFNANGWTSIYFGNLFEYNGTSNVVLVVEDHSNSYNTYTSFRTFDATGNQALRIYDYNGITYDPTAPSTYTGTLLSVKNQVVFGIPTYGYTVTATASPTNSGTVTGGGNCYYGQPITLTATPTDGYVFNNWTKNGEVVSYLSTYNLNVTETATYVANFEAIDGIAIGDATYTNYTLPTYYYNSLTEQIYTAAEMGGESTDISSVSFFNTTGYSRTRNLSVYLAHTNKTSFESNTDWIAVTEDDLVFSGNVTFNANGWTSIYFGDLFEYNGTSNVVLVVEDHSNNYNTYTSFRTFDASGNQTLRIYDYNYGVTYDPTDPSAYTGTLLSVKNQVVFGIPNPQYTVTTTVTPADGGTVSGGDGLYYLGQSCTLTATANSGYGFYYWRENGTIKSYDPVYTFPVMGNTQLEAYFGEPFTITVTSNPEEGGTVSGGGDFGYNQQCTLTATANEGYLFSKWTKNSSSSAVACLPTYTFSVTAQATYVAQFTQIDGIAIGEPTSSNYYLPSYTYYPYSLTQQIYTAEELNSGACEISSVTFFNAGYGETRNLTVYMVNTNKTSFSSTTDWIAVTEADKVFEGNFTTLYRNWSTLYFNTAFQYDGHSNVALIIDDNSNNWNGNTYCRTFETQTTQAIRICGSGENYNPSNPSNYTGTLMSVKNQVVFGIPNYQYYVSVSAEPEGSGTVSGNGGPYFYGQPITITATANDGYVFDYWTRYNEDYGYDEVVSYFSPDNLPVLGDVEYVAHFHEMDGIAIGEPNNSNYYLPDYSYYPYSMSEQIYTAAEMGTEAHDISSVSFFNTGYYNITRNLSIYMVNTNKTKFNSEYDWISVTNSNLVFSGEVSMDGDSWITIYFNTAFAYNGSSNVALVFVDNTGEWGSEILCRTFDTQNTEAIYALGYDSAFDPSNPYNYYGNLVAQKNQVVFGIADYQYYVTVSANPTNGGTVTGNGGPYFYGQPVTLTATANEGYVFNNWTKDGEIVSGSSTFVLSVTETASYVANFQQVNGSVIGDGTMTNYYLPTYSYYPYTLSQQIYTADEIGSGVDDISSVSFFNTGDARTRNFSIYLAHTNKTAFESTTDWITVTEDNLVFSGNVTLASNSWTTIYFGTLFTYDGSSNVVLVVDDNTNSWYSGVSCRTFGTDENQAIRISGSGTNYDPTNPSSYSGTLMSQKNQIILGTPSYDYTVSVSVNPTNSGTVSGNAGTFYLGQNCTLTATANPGYVFYNWTIDGSSVSTSAVYTFPVTGNMSLVANFGTPIAITATASPEQGGTITGSGNYAQGHTCTLTATANDKYVFINWTNASGSVVSWLSTYSFTVNSAASYVANFQRVDNGIVIGDASSTSYNLPSYTYYPYYLSEQIYTADEIGMECDIANVAFFNTSTTTVSNRNFTVYLIPTDKTSFTGNYDWVAATEADRVFSGNVTIKSRDWTIITFDTPFHYDGTSNLILVVDDNTASYGNSVPFRTYATSDYQSIYGYNYSTDLNPLNPTNYSGNRIKAKNQVIFGFSSTNYTVTVSSEPSYAGSATGGGIFASGQPCLVSAIANEGYCFYNWTENGEVVSTDATYSFMVTDNRNLVAHFGEPVTITASVEPEVGGTVIGAGLYAPGHICNLTATPNDGYTFISWTKDGEVVSYLSSYTFIVEGSADYVANFAQISSCIAIGDAFGVTPYLPSNSYYNYSVSQQIYTAAEMGGANEISSIAFFNTGSTKTRNFTIYLKHTSKDAFNSDSDWITVNNSNKVFSGNVTFTSGNWTYIIFTRPFAYNGTSNLVLTVDDNTNDYSYGMNCRVFVANGTQALQAFSDDVNYNPKSPSSYSGSLMTLKNQVIFGLSGNIFNVFATANPTVGGTVAGGGVYQGGSTCTLTATPANGYHFFYWKENNAVASMANPYEFTVESDRNLTAHFEQVTNHWTTDGSAYSDNMALTGVVQINGVEQRSDLLEVAAFCGTECRGTQLLTYFAPTDRYLLWMTVYGQNGDALTFKVYDHRLAQELDMTSPNLTFNTNGYGTPNNPYILDFTSAVTINQPLTSGWNWWSTYIDMEDNNGLEQLEESLGSNGVSITTQGASLLYRNGRWIGSISSIDNRRGYKINTNAPVVVSMSGFFIDPADCPITIQEGWNWIGYPNTQSLSVNDALSGFTPEANDQIKGRDGYATFISIGQYHYWDGTLNTLEPGHGYMYLSNSTAQKTLVYQTNRTMEPLPNITPEGNFHTPQSAAYADNMTITSVIELDGQELRADNYELAAFVGDECRGSVKLMYVEPFDRYVAFLTVFGEASEEMRFVLTNGRAASKSTDCINYAKDASIGTLDEPAVLHFGTLGVNDLDGKGWMAIYPNPIDRNETFSLVIPEDETIEETIVVNVLGEVVDHKTGHIVTSRMSGLPTSGIYTVKVVCRSGNTYIGKVVVK